MAAPVPRQLQQKHCLAVRYPPRQPLPALTPSNKGPVIRKSVEAFYFAAHAYARLQTPVEVDRTWSRAVTANGVAVGLFTKWYPEVGTLVLAYAADQNFIPLSPCAQTTYVPPFYVPASWDTGVAPEFNQAFKLLHVSGTSNEPHDALKSANARLRGFSDKAEPLRIILTGLGGGGSLASVAAPWVALAYPSADTRLITFGAPGVRSQQFMLLTEWAVGIRLPVVIERDPVVAAHRQGAPNGLELPDICLHLPDDSPRITNRTSLEAYLVALWGRFDTAEFIQTSGTGFADGQVVPGSFWGTPGIGYGDQLNTGARDVLDSNTPRQTAIKWALQLNLESDVPAGVPPLQPPAGADDPGFLDTPFSRIPGPNCPETLNQFLQCLALSILRQPSRYSEGAYAVNTIPDDFINFTRIPSAHPNVHDDVALVSDPLSGSDMYVVFIRSSATLIFDFRGTQPYEISDIFTDIDFLQIRAALFNDVDPQIPRVPNDHVVASGDTALVHRGFLGQFQAIAGMEGFSWSDLKTATGFGRALQALFRWMLRLNARLPGNPNIAEVASHLARGAMPVRVLCCGHSLGGALATIASVWAALTYPDADVRCVTFGSPMVGNEGFVNAWRQVVGTRLRAVHAADPVPSLPPICFSHVFPVVWLRPGPPPEAELHYANFTRPLFDFRDCRTVLLGPINIVDHMMACGYRKTLYAILRRMRELGTCLQGAILPPKH